MRKETAQRFGRKLKPTIKNYVRKRCLGDVVLEIVSRKRKPYEAEIFLFVEPLKTVITDVGFVDGRIRYATVIDKNFKTDEWVLKYNPNNTVTIESLDCKFTYSDSKQIIVVIPREIMHLAANLGDVKMWCYTQSANAVEL